MAKKEKLVIEHKPLHCPICGQRFMNIVGQPLPNHTQVHCWTSNGDEMDIAVCRDCAKKGISIEMLNGILEGFKVHWDFEVDQDETLGAAEKKRRKAFGRSHKVASFDRVVNTGERAEKDARNKGKLR